MSMLLLLKSTKTGGLNKQNLLSQGSKESPLDSPEGSKGKTVSLSCSGPSFPYTDSHIFPLTNESLGLCTTLGRGFLNVKLNSGLSKKTNAKGKAVLTQDTKKRFIACSSSWNSSESKEIMFP